jgi:hypothetical protein
LSHEKLRSFEMREKLRELRATDDPFWAELTCTNPRPVTGAVVVEDIEIPEAEEELDDSDVNLRDVIAATHREAVPERRRGRTFILENGGLVSAADAENIEEIPKPVEEREAEDIGRGKRKKTANRLYHLSDFARHWDNEASDIE